MENGEVYIYMGQHYNKTYKKATLWIARFKEKWWQHSPNSFRI